MSSRMWFLSAYALFISLLFMGIMSGGCARLPYTTTVIHEDRRVVVSLQRDPHAVSYTHPVHLQADELAAVLNGFSFREKQRVPLRWFAEEVPPKRIFRQDEMQALVAFLVAGLEKAAPDERVYFQVLAPGMNPAAERDTTAGWIAVREPYPPSSARALPRPVSHSEIGTVGPALSRHPSGAKDVPAVLRAGTVLGNRAGERQASRAAS